MRAPALGLALLLSACAATPSYRDPAAPISSAAVFDPARFAGTWHEVAAFPGVSACLGATETWTPRPDAAFAVARNCHGARSEGEGHITGPGRLSLRMGATEPEPVWVLWVDQDYRTAVLGQPAGKAGRVLNRDPRIPADRMAAAREILVFNGYDLARLETAGP